MNRYRVPLKPFGAESVNNAWQTILKDLKLECGLTFTVESRKAERACVNMTSILDLLESS